MRLMTKNKTELKIHTHIITRNFWEFYLEEPDADGIAFGLVMGHETELGSVDLNEIKPHAISTTQNLYEVMPAEGWSWADEGEDDNV